MAQLPIYGYQGGKTKKVVGQAVVDDDLPTLQQHSWYMWGPYAATSIQGTKKHLYYFVWEHHHGPDSVPDGLYLDHLNQDKLDNRIANVVLVDDRVKQANAPKHRDNTSGYKDVFRQKSGKFTAVVKRDYRPNYFGNYSTAEEAAYAVNLGYQLLHPEVPAPNPTVESLLTSHQKMTVDTNVQRLSRPDREPGKA